MAVTDIQATVLRITGVTPTANSVEDAQRFVVSSVPKDLLMFAQKASSPSTDGSAISFSVNDSIADVQRNGYGCTEIPMSDAVWALDSSSLRFATAKHPVFYHKQGAVHFAPVTDGSNAGYVFYVDFSLIDDSCDLRNAVIYHACSGEFTKLATSKVVDWTDLVVPVLPTLSTNAVSFSQTAPIYVKPALSLTSFPSITWTFPSVPSIPITSAQTVADFSSTAPTFTAPPMSPPDFSDTNNWISTEEDSEMLSSRVQEIQAKIGEYSARLGEAQAEFNKENVIYQATIQEKMQEAQLSDADENRKLQIFQNEISNYQAEVNKVIAGNQGEIAEWQQRSAVDLQKYSADIQNELNEFNKQNVEYQSQLQIAIQDAQLSSQDDAQKLQDYSAKVQTYSGEVNEMVSKSSAATQNASYYSKESDKYYKWASAEIQMYIQNNSKIINRTMAAQAAQQQGRR